MSEFGIESAFWEELAKIAYDSKKGPDWKTLKKNKVPLTPEERAKVMKAKAVWHHAPSRKATPAVGKSVVNGKTWYETHTHRAVNVRPTLKGAIRRFHDFIKGTA